MPAGMPSVPVAWVGGRIRRLEVMGPRGGSERTGSHVSWLGRVRKPRFSVLGGRIERSEALCGPDPGFRERPTWLPGGSHGSDVASGWFRALGAGLPSFQRLAVLPDGPHAAEVVDGVYQRLDVGGREAGVVDEVAQPPDPRAPGSLRRDSACGRPRVPPPSGRAGWDTVRSSEIMGSSTGRGPLPEKAVSLSALRVYW